MTKARDIATGGGVDTTNFVTKSNGVIEALDGSALTSLTPANLDSTGTIPTALLDDVGGGKLAQLVQTTSTSESDFNSSTYANFFDLDITPTASGNKVLVIISIAGVGHHSGASGGKIRLVKEGSELTTLIPYSSDDGDTSRNFYASNETFFFLDNNTASGVATNYEVQCANVNSTGAFRVNSNSNCHSSLTLMEIAS